MFLLKQRTTIPGFHLALGYTVLYLSLIVLIPLSMLFVKTSSISFSQLVVVVTDTPKNIHKDEVIVEFKFSKNDLISTLTPYMSMNLVNFLKFFPGRYVNCTGFVIELLYGSGFYCARDDLFSPESYLKEQEITLDLKKLDIGKVVHMIERHNIEGRPAQMIAANLMQAFETYC